MTPRLVVAALFAALNFVVVTPAWAQSDPDPDDPLPTRWDKAFELSSVGGVLNPGVLVGFNPQPEPPRRITRLDLFDSSEPTLVLEDQANQNGELQIFDVFLALNLRTLEFEYDDPEIMDVGGSVRTRASAAGAVLFEIIFDISSSSGGLLDPASLVGFDPQPEPPAGFLGAFGMSFGISSLSDAIVSLRILDAEGSELSFTQVPEQVPAPGTLGLIGLGFITTAWVWRRYSR